MNNIKVVLDSCILIYACDPDTKESCLKLIKEFLSNKYIITHSSLSGFEVLKNRQETDNEKEYTNLMNQLWRIPIDTPVLMNASTLYFLYKASGKINVKNDSSETLIDRKDKLTGDLIIGGTVISYKNHTLLTANKKDFPEPYWKQVSEHEIVTVKNTKIKVFLLEPNMKQILTKLEKDITNPETWPSRTNSYEYRG